MSNTKKLIPIHQPIAGAALFVLLCCSYGKRFMGTIWQSSCFTRNYSQQYDSKWILLFLMGLNHTALTFSWQLYISLKQDRDFGGKMKSLVKKAQGVTTFGGMSHTSAEGTTHSVAAEERVAFCNWINK